MKTPPKSPSKHSANEFGVVPSVHAAFMGKSQTDIINMRIQAMCRAANRVTMAKKLSNIIRIKKAPILRIP